jgi:hypothetical protein
MAGTPYQFRFEPAIHVEQNCDGWAAQDYRLKLLAFGPTEEEARRQLAQITDDLISSLAAEGTDVLHEYFLEHGVPHSLTPVALDVHPEEDDDEDLVPLEDLHARHGVA